MLEYEIYMVYRELGLDTFKIKVIIAAAHYLLLTPTNTFWAP